MSVAEFLTDHQVPFETIYHAPAFSAQKRAKYLHTPGKQVAKPAKTARTAKASKGQTPPKAAKPGKSRAAGQSGKVRKFVKPSQFGKRSN